MTAVNLRGYHLSFDAEFTSASDMNYFTNAFTNGATSIPSNGELETYVPYTTGSSTYSIQDGELTITAAPVSQGRSSYTSGMVTTGTDGPYQNYGYFEIRAELPSGAGFWPAFWMLAGGPTDFSSEIDIFEQPNLYGVQDYYTSIKTPTYNNGQFDYSGDDLSAGYHTYGLMWTATTMQFTFDGRYVGSAIATPPALQGQEMYLLANLAVGGWAGAPAAGATAQLKIDYIRAYSNDPAVPVWYGSGEAISSPDGADTTPNLVTTPASPGEDFTGDGKSDLLMQNDSGAIDILTQANLGITGCISLGNPGASWHVVGNADLNGDGQDDILLQNSNGQVVDYLMNGTTVVSALALSNAGPSWHVRGVSDFSAGKADILLQSDDGSMVFWYTNGTAVTGTAAVGNPGPGWTVEGAGDFNGNGQTDILVQNTNGAIVDYSLNGAVITSGAYLGTPGAGWAIAGTGDYNGDGKSDLVLHNDTGQNVIWETDGSSILNAVDLGNPGPAYPGVVAGVDLNGDGSSDLVLQNTDSTLVGFTLNENAAVTASTSLGMPGAGWHALGDVPMEFIDGTGAKTNLTATAGADQFDLTSYTPGLHQIAGFDAAQDSVVLNRSAFPTFAAVQAAEQPYGNGTYVPFTSGSGLVIQGVTPGQLNPGNFLLR